jgi:phosphoribosyl-ATP pyrophosphohydrolase
MANQPSILAQLMAVIEDRKRNRPAKSYTTGLLDGGVETIGAKVLEESNELIEAARRAGPETGSAIIHEAADLLYHLLVLLAHCDIRLTDVEAELQRRFGISGLEEKASRKRD